LETEARDMSSARYFGTGFSAPVEEKKNKKSIFSEKRKEKKKKAKDKSREPVKQGSIDNWFYKNFGLNKLFDDEDQSLEE